MRRYQRHKDNLIAKSEMDEFNLIRYWWLYDEDEYYDYPYPINDVVNYTYLKSNPKDEFIISRYRGLKTINKMVARELKIDMESFYTKEKRRDIIIGKIIGEIDYTNTIGSVMSLKIKN